MEDVKFSECLYKCNNELVNFDNRELNSFVEIDYAVSYLNNEKALIEQFESFIESLIEGYKRFCKTLSDPDFSRMRSYSSNCHLLKNFLRLKRQQKELFSNIASELEKFTQSEDFKKIKEMKNSLSLQVKDLLQIKKTYDRRDSFYKKLTSALKNNKESENVSKIADYYNEYHTELDKYTEQRNSAFAAVDRVIEDVSVVFRRLIDESFKIEMEIPKFFTTDHLNTGTIISKLTGEGFGREIFEDLNMEFEHTDIMSKVVLISDVKISNGTILKATDKEEFTLIKSYGNNWTIRSLTNNQEYIVPCEVLELRNDI